MKIIFIFILSIICSSVATADPMVWKPKMQFELEDSDISKTMLFISGMAYALNEYSRQLRVAKRTPLYCMPVGEIANSPLIFEILNRKYAGKKISANQATSATLSGLTEAYPCK